jgi:EAL domain-containing protein (putative c-di-GMP-specific phosphodiesterase class I)
VHQTLTRLREAGIHVVIDDFGTGCSSLAQLSRLRFDKLKIDRSFIGQMNHSVDQATLVRAIIGLGRGLGLTTVAEGVESIGQLQFLQEEGCELGQGFLFSRAVTAEEALTIARGSVGPRSVKAV